jgi:hypothetical protein
MSLNKALQRERKQRKARYGMRISGRSIFTIQAVQVERAAGGKRKQRRKRQR